MEDEGRMTLSKKEVDEEYKRRADKGIKSRPVQTYEKPKGAGNYKEEFENTFKGAAESARIVREFRSNHRLRKVYAFLVISGQPEKIGEIKDGSVFVQNSTMYGYLKILINWGFVEIIPISDVWNKNKLTLQQKEALKKFKKWTSTMSESQRANWLKTKYWVVTEKGKDETIMRNVISLEKEFQNGGVN